MNFKYLIVVLLFLSSCSIAQKNLIGTYTYKVPGWINAQMTIKSDSTFIYNYQSGLEGTEVRGKWKTSKNDFIVFNSDKSPIKDSLKVEEESTKDYKDSITFVVKNFEGEPLGSAGITFKNVPDFGIVLNKEGQAKVSNELNIEQFTIHYLGYQYSYKVINKEVSFLKVQVYYPLPEEAFYRFFINEKWRLKKNKLIDLGSEKKFKYKKKPGE